MKITFGDMRRMDVSGILVYCADYRCGHLVKMDPHNGQTTFGYPTSNQSLSAALAANAARTCVKIIASTQHPGQN